MIDRFQEVIADAVRKQWDEQERILQQAFQNHFGYPFEKADKTKFDRVIGINSPVQQFRYDSETFLLWDESEEPNYESGVNYWRCTHTVKYLMV